MKPREITSPLRSPLQGTPKPHVPRKRSDGRCEVLCDYLREKVGDLDGTELDNRRACWTLILRAEKVNPEADATQTIRTLIDIATDPSNWHAKNVTNFRYLLNHARQIANGHRERFAKRSKLTDALRKADEHFTGKPGS